MKDPSLLRFLVDLRGEETTNVQLRDDLMTMLVAGHETTAAVLTWATFLMATHPEVMREAQEEVDAVMGKQQRKPTYQEIMVRAMECVRAWVCAGGLRGPQVHIRIQWDLIPTRWAGKPQQLVTQARIFATRMKCTRR